MKIYKYLRTYVRIYFLRKIMVETVSHITAHLRDNIKMSMSSAFSFSLLRGCTKSSNHRTHISNIDELLMRETKKFLVFKTTDAVAIERCQIQLLKCKIETCENMTFYRRNRLFRGYHNFVQNSLQMSRYQLFSNIYELLMPATRKFLV